MYSNSLTTRNLIECSYSLAETLQHLRHRGVALTADTLCLYMSNNQKFPRFINVYNAKLANRERRWLKSDVATWVPAKVRRQREQVIFLERKIEVLKQELDYEESKGVREENRKTRGWG